MLVTLNYLNAKIRYFSIEKYLKFKLRLSKNEED